MTQVTHLETNKVCDLAKVIAQLNHPYAPGIATITIKGFKVTTKLKNGLACNLQFEDEISLKEFVEAAKKNQGLNNIFIASETRKNVDFNYINPSAFLKRRSSGYHGIKW